jgi:hypothetical protein
VASGKRAEPEAASGKRIDPGGEPEALAGRGLGARRPAKKRDEDLASLLSFVDQLRTIPAWDQTPDDLPDARRGQAEPEPTKQEPDPDEFDDREPDPDEFEDRDSDPYEFPDREPDPIELDDRKSDPDQGPDRAPDQGGSADPEPDEDEVRDQGSGKRRLPPRKSGQREFRARNLAPTAETSGPSDVTRWDPPVTVRVPDRFITPTGDEDGLDFTAPTPEDELQPASGERPGRRRGRGPRREDDGSQPSDDASHEDEEAETWR